MDLRDRVRIRRGAARGATARGHYLALKRVIEIVANFAPTLSLAATWIPVSQDLLSANNTGGLAQTTYGHIQLNGLSSIVISGWGWGGGFGTNSSLASPEPVHIEILEQQADGTLKLATAQYVSSDVISGANSVIVADFNGDGKSDIFLPAHNESPFKAMPSTLYLSNGAGGFDKTSVDDSVMAHDAQLAMIKGVPTVFSATFTPGDTNPVYTFANGKLSTTIPTNLSQVFHQSIAVGNFGANGQLAVAMGDVYASDPADNAKIKIYGYAGGDVSSITPMATITPYLSVKHPDFTSLYGKGITHTYRILVDDFNHDGKSDLLAEESMWVSGANFPSVLQMLQNDGNWHFVDKTDQLGSGFDQDAQELDYQTQLIDIDQSGINSYLMAGVPAGALVNGKLTFDNSRAPNYLFLNDGTGQLHVGLHEQFLDLGAQVITYLNKLAGKSPDGSQNFYIGADLASAGVPKFVGFQTVDGALNFVAEVSVGRWVSPGIWGVETLLVNVPLHYNPTTDYTDAVTINDRNGSHLIRTFAGNDLINGATDHGYCKIDGGNGIDTVIYAGNRANFAIGQDGSSYTVTDNAGAAGSDTLVNVERVRFADATVALDIAGNGGEAYRIYQAAFNRTPDSGGVGYWISMLDHGASLESVATGFVNSDEWATIYGASPTNAEVVDKLYTNVLHRAPDAGGAAYWTKVLDTKAATLAQVLVGFSESPENQAGLIGVIGHGFSYTPFIG
ncbi:MAG: DUF4214 domain-containing protein [Massilia sp.]